jgi:hypothetical protein
MDEKEHKEILDEFNAMISHADGKTESISIRKDPALSRNLEWLRDSYLELYKENYNLTHKVL